METDQVSHLSYSDCILTEHESLIMNPLLFSLYIYSAELLRSLWGLVCTLLCNLLIQRRCAQKWLLVFCSIPFHSQIFHLYSWSRIQRDCLLRGEELAASGKCNFQVLKSTQVPLLSPSSRPLSYPILWWYWQTWGNKVAFGVRRVCILVLPIISQ